MPKALAKSQQASKHKEISEALRDKILSGRYGAVGKMPSEAQLVKRFKASRPTVARALRTLQDEGLVERHAGSGTFAIQGGSRKRPLATRTLALLIPGLRNTEIFQMISGEIASLARVQDFALIWGGSAQPRLDTDTSLEHGMELCEQFIAKRVDGVFFAPYELVEGQTVFNRSIATKLSHAGIPIILIDRDLTAFPGRSEFDLIGMDQVGAGFIIGEHLIKLGCKNLCFVHPPRSAPTINARIAGLREAMVAHGLDSGAHWIFEGDVQNAVFLRKVLAQGKPEAIVCPNDYTAALVLQGLAKMGLRVPQDVKIVGFDDVRFATLVSPPLTTIHQPYHEIALTAFRAMTERLEQPLLPPRQISLCPRLVIRDSCGAYL